MGLRALLIQKSVKLLSYYQSEEPGLRALLIQKSVKQSEKRDGNLLGLRALLIQKSVKLLMILLAIDLV